MSSSPANYLEWKKRSRSFETMGAFTQNRVTLTGNGRAGRVVSTIVVTADLFDVLGVSPILGRGFREGEDQDGAARTMVLSESTLDSADSAATRRSSAARVTIDGGPVTVIGVMPAGFEVLGQRADVYIPFQHGDSGSSILGPQPRRLSAG